METKSARRARPKQLSIPWIVGIDVFLIGVCLVVFALFDHVLPRSIQRVAVGSLNLEGSPDGDFSDRFPDKFTSGEVISTPSRYQSRDLNITLTKYDSIIDDEDKVVYFVEDIYIRNIECLRTIFANDTYGRSISEPVLSMSKRANAVAAINADFYSVKDDGIVIRNGELYRDTFAADQDVLVLYRDGTMKVYEGKDELDIEKAMEDGAWQAFNFGPSFLYENGRAKEKEVLPRSPRGHHPRTILGMIEPGHYLFIVVDGRRDDYSVGLRIEQCAQLCEKLGCAVAYNLDGGGTSQMTYLDEMANDPYNGGRKTSDLIYVADLAA